MTVLLDSTERGARAPVALRRLRELTRLTLTAAETKERRIELSVAFVNTARSRALNERYRGKHKPADVLSFSLESSGSFRSPAALLGEIVICPPTVRKKAKSAGRSMTRHCELLFVHGLLHLLGYDHQGPADERRMHGIEEKIADERFDF